MPLFLAHQTHSWESMGNFQDVQPSVLIMATQGCGVISIVCRGLHHCIAMEVCQHFSLSTLHTADGKINKEVWQLDKVSSLEPCASVV